MADPSSQIIANWVKQDLSGAEWIRLDEACKRVLAVRLTGATQTHISDIVESNVSYVAHYLREEQATYVVDGTPPEFEIDNEAMPYLRLADHVTAPMLSKLRRVDPFEFEGVCAKILARLGAQADVTKRTNDDGVDFYAIDFDFVPDGIKTPQACRAAVIGQAKRYKDGHFVRETDVRAFIGGGYEGQARSNAGEENTAPEPSTLCLLDNF